MPYYCSSAANRLDHTIFFVGQDEIGHHFVRENHGLIGGEFVTREDALRFARDESSIVSGSIVVIAPELTLWTELLASAGAFA